MSFLRKNKKSPPDIRLISFNISLILSPNDNVAISKTTYLLFSNDFH